ncbi:head-tail joining protein [Rhodovulum sulfidophilum]|uniref:Uncharacterized protein n=1 Tax=Rhodovulum sulfidophilum TaxID=35806 RepID=A0ABS1RYV5_RHOSU|nr:hypothetical protein [Rhodovulum sulfidophilum]MBL3611271.1 hypothetical protein [Rhodovulum sulfidophilum]MCE8455435.1 hypothetical protein [Rhodovulum sulfidophilum]
MASVFDGMGALLTGALGAPVTIAPSGEAPRRIRALFRDADTAILTEGGAEVLNAVPTLQARRDQLSGLCPGGLVDLADGRRFRALAPMDGGNPDPGGMVTIQLEEA